jgi:hypothetical protein
MNRKLKYSFSILACLGTCSIFIFVGYQYFSENEKELNEKIENNISKVAKPIQNNNTTDESVKIEEDKINSSTKMVYEYHFKEDGAIEKNYEMPPYFLIGLTKEGLEEKFVDWKIINFSNKEVIMKKDIEGKSTQHYVIGVQDGFVAIFYENDINGSNLKDITDMPISALSEEEQERLHNGIPIAGEKKLIQALEDYGS